MDVEKTIEFILEQQARTAAILARMAEGQDHADEERAKDREYLRHAVRLAIREARAERTKRRELDDKIGQLAAAQLLTEEKVQHLSVTVEDLSATVKAFIQSMRRGPNGQGTQPA